MHIDFEMSGGYGGLFARRPLALHFETDDLPAEARREFLALIETSDLVELRPEDYPPGPASRPDVFVYSLSITDAGVTRAFRFDDVTVPPGLRPLLRHLQAQAVAARVKSG